MSGLIKNEFIKIIYRKKTWVVFSLFMLVLLAVMLAYENRVENERSHMSFSQLIFWEEDHLMWLEEEIERLSALEESEIFEDIDMLELSLEQLEGVTEQLKRLNEFYQLELQGLPIDFTAEYERRIAQTYEEIERNDDRIAQLQQENQTAEMRNSIAAFENFQEQLYWEIRLLEEHLALNPYFNPWHINRDSWSHYQFTLFEMNRQFGMQVGGFFLSFGMMIMLADMVAGEKTPGTFKFLLCQPISRRKVLLSKMIVSAVMSTGLIIGGKLFMLLIVGIRTNFIGGDMPIIIGKIEHINNFFGETVGAYYFHNPRFITMNAYMWRSLGILAIIIVLLTITATLFSCLLKSSLLAMIVSVVLAISLQILTATPDLSWLAVYVPFNLGDTAQMVVYDGFLHWNGNWWQGSTVALIVFVLFIVMTLLQDRVFKKEDISN